MLLSMYIFLYTNVFYVNALIRWTSLADLTLWGLIFPLHLLYYFYSYFAPPAFVVLTTQILYLRQRHLLKEFERVCCQKSRHRKRCKNALWRKYLSLNRQLASLSVNIERCASFWSAPLSAYFGGFLLIQCYLMYILLFIQGLPLITRLFFGYIVLVTEMFHYVLIAQCAKVAKGSGRLEAVNGRFYRLAFLQAKILQGKIRVILKAESFALARRLLPYAMRLLDNYRVTSKTFYLVVNYTTLFFMMVFKFFNKK